MTNPGRVQGSARARLARLIWFDGTAISRGNERKISTPHRRVLTYCREQKIGSRVRTTRWMTLCRMRVQAASRL